MMYVFRVFLILMILLARSLDVCCDIVVRPLRAVLSFTRRDSSEQVAAHTLSLET